ncbi:hypothetical protein CB0940_09664 [Cercospora beticola]|uniref:Uncharacterized protein n=1 Tax=Cercospora beticola TaxID=122368 RepID=A0A2G5HIE2_CERBT|nr:hypothetical protein CB0940_09664 [Cercospora beticola]PIA92308.1 hypothetical protein CB0940_09664 [Cercospora beticola]WPB05998.1 hypothetical protein RHO25_010653 [Cercospora beticola]
MVSRKRTYSKVAEQKDQNEQSNQTATTNTMAKKKQKAQSIRGSYREEEFWRLILRAIREQRESGRIRKFAKTQFPPFERKDKDKDKSA